MRKKYPTAPSNLSATWPKRVVLETPWRSLLANGSDFAQANPAAGYIRGEKYSNYGMERFCNKRVFRWQTRQKSVKTCGGARARERIRFIGVNLRERASISPLKGDNISAQGFNPGSGVWPFFWAAN